MYALTKMVTLRLKRNSLTSNYETCSAPVKLTHYLRLLASTRVPFYQIITIISYLNSYYDWLAIILAGVYKSMYKYPNSFKFPDRLVALDPLKFSPAERSKGYIYSTFSCLSCVKCKSYTPT